MTTQEFLVLIFSTAALIAYLLPGFLLPEKGAGPKRSSAKKTTAASPEFLVLVLILSTAALTLPGLLSAKRKKWTATRTAKTAPVPHKTQPASPARQVETTARAAKGNPP